MHRNLPSCHAVPHSVAPLALPHNGVVPEPLAPHSIHTPHTREHEPRSSAAAHIRSALRRNSDSNACCSALCSLVGPRIDRTAWGRWIGVEASCGFDDTLRIKFLARLTYYVEWNETSAASVTTLEHHSEWNGHNFGTTLRQLWDNFQITLVQLLNAFEISLGQLRDKFETICNDFGTVLSKCNDNFGTNLTQLWHHIVTKKWLLAERT